MTWRKQEIQLVARALSRCTRRAIRTPQFIMMKEAALQAPVGTLERRESSAFCADLRKKLPKEFVFQKMDKLMRDMLASKTGLQVKTQRAFFLTVANCFTGKDLTKWLQEHLDTDDVNEAQQLGLMLCHLGYICPVLSERSLSFKADASLYRFQKAELWPTRKWETQGKDYAVYLKKKMERHASGNGSALEPHEQSALNKLQLLLPTDDWKRVCAIAKQQADASAAKSKAERETEELQERTFWRLHRPPPGCSTPLEDYSGKRMHHYESLRQKRKVDLLIKKITIYKQSLANSSSVTSKGTQMLANYCSQFQAVDPLLDSSNRSNHWFIEDEDFWELQSLTEQSEPEDRLSAEQVQRWSFDLRALLRDSAGRHRFANFLKQQYSVENLLFWEACEELKRCPKSQLEHKVRSIMNTFLRVDAPFEVNLNTTVLQKISEELGASVNRFALEEAQHHIYQLMKDDCYPRFLRSEFYHDAVYETSPTSSRHSRPSPAPERKSSFEGSSSIGSSSSSKNTQFNRPLPKQVGGTGDTSSVSNVTSPVVLRSHVAKSSFDKLMTPSEIIGRKLSVPPHAASTSMLEVLHHQPLLHRAPNESHSTDDLAEGMCSTLKKAESLSSLHAGGKGRESDEIHDAISDFTDKQNIILRQSRHGSLRKMGSPIFFLKRVHF